MTIPEQRAASSEEFKVMAELAGLGMSTEELQDLRPLYDLYFEYIKVLHSIDFQAEEIGLTFHPDWPSA